MKTQGSDGLASLWINASRLSFFSLSQLAEHALVDRDIATRFIAEHNHLFERLDDTDTWGVRADAIRQVAQRAAAAAMTLDPLTEDLKMSPAIRPTQLEQLEGVLAFLEAQRELDAEARDLELLHAQMNLNGAQVVFRDQLAVERAHAERTAQRIENAKARLRNIQEPTAPSQPPLDWNAINAECQDDDAADRIIAEQALIDWSATSSSAGRTCPPEAAEGPEAFLQHAVEQIRGSTAAHAPYAAAVWVPEVLAAWPAEQLQVLRNLLVGRLEGHAPEDPPETFAALSVLAAKVNAELAATAIFQRLLISRIERRLAGVNRRAVLRSLATFARPGRSTSWQIAASAACYFVGLPDVTAEDFVTLSPAALRSTTINLRTHLLKLAIHLGAPGRPSVALAPNELRGVFRNVAMALHADAFSALGEVLADLAADQQRGEWLLRQLDAPTHGALELTDKCDLAPFGIRLRDPTATALGVLASKPTPIQFDFHSPTGKVLNEIIRLHKGFADDDNVIDFNRVLLSRSKAGLPWNQPEQKTAGR